MAFSAENDSALSVGPRILRVAMVVVQHLGKLWKNETQHVVLGKLKSTSALAC